MAEEKKEPTAEQELLNLIEGTDAKDGGEAKAPAPKPPPKAEEGTAPDEPPSSGEADSAAKEEQPKPEDPVSQEPPKAAEEPKAEEPPSVDKLASVVGVGDQATGAGKAVADNVAATIGAAAQNTASDPSVTEQLTQDSQMLPRGQASVAARQAPLFSAGVIKGKIAFLQDSFRNMTKSGDIEGPLTLANNILILSICVLFFFLGYQVLVKPDKFESLPDLISIKRDFVERQVTMIPLKEISFYLDKLRIRDIFQPKVEEVEAPEEEEVKPSFVSEAIKGLKLVGLSPSGEKTESFIMIEIKESGATFFLREGDTVSGLIVDRILVDRVVLSDGEETAELR